MNGGRATDTLSDALLRDFRVTDAAVALIDLGEAALRVSRSASPRLHLVLEGEVMIESADHPPEQLGPGDMILLFYGDSHRILAGGGAREALLPPLGATGVGRIDAARGRVRAVLLSFALELSYVAPAAAVIRAAPWAWPMRCGAAAGDARALDLDVGQIRAACGGPGARAFCLAIANLLVVHGMRAMYSAQWSDARMEVRSPATRRVAAAVQAIEAHPERAWTVGSLAQAVGISRSSFAAAFREALGVAPLTYVRTIRLERARRLLESGALSVTEVARRTGYPLPSSFARAFTQRYGRPPSRG
jgi:AraC-like DNA-binding protein